MKISLSILLLPLVAGAALGQTGNDLNRAWLPPLLGNPSKLSPDRFADDEDPVVVRDDSGRLWVAWYGCRPESSKLPENKIDLRNWEWQDDGKDSILVRWFDGKNWSKEENISTRPGVNWNPEIVPDQGGVRVLWTSLRDGQWAAYERRWRNGQWDTESRIPESDGSLEIRAARLSDGSLLAIFKKPIPPRIELQTSIYRGGTWEKPVRLDDGRGRCHRASILPLSGTGWMIAWDEERDGNYDVWVRDQSGAPQRLTDSELWDTTPALAQTADKRIWVVWERKETIGGRLAYKGRSIFGKVWDGAQWQWAPSPFPSSDPGRLTRHSRFWATEGISEERYPKLIARSNGELWLFWVGGGRMSSTSFAARVWRDGKWSDPRILFWDSIPDAAFSLPSVQQGVDLRVAFGHGPYQMDLFNEMSIWLDDASGMLSMAYEVPKRRNQSDLMIADQIQARPSGYGADIFFHRVDLDEHEYRLARVVDDESPIPPLKTRPYRPTVLRTLEINGQKYRLVFGDMHGHTENDAIGTVDMYYTHGLFIAGMDYLASTNHDFTPDLITQSKWALTKALAAVYNGVQGRVAFSGYEWTTDPNDARGGHRAMYFLADTGVLHRSTTQATDTVEKLYQVLRGEQVILQPHHNGWEGYDPKLQPVLEITSAWRQLREESNDLKPAGKVESAWEALERGYRIAFVGSGDSHWLGPGEDYGITGAYVKDLTREGVFEAIRARRVFASTGARMILDFRVNDTFMGGETTAKISPRIFIDATGDGDIERVEIVRDHRIIYAQPESGTRVKFQFIDQSGNPDHRPFSYYYVRITQKDQMKVWSSPVWVDWR